MVSAPEKEKKQEETPQEQEVHEAIVARETEVTKDLSHVRDYLQEVESEPSPVADDRGQPLLTPSQPAPTTITLPLTEEEIKHGLHHKIIDSVRWLALWCVRMAKKAVKLGLKVIYRKQ